MSGVLGNGYMSSHCSDLVNHENTVQLSLLRTDFYEKRER